MTVSRPGPRRIRRLAADMIERIAAGEVVENPASVVKELVENAVDAGATQVEIRLRRGGLELIAVEDDGVGIPAEDLPLAVERHATSKLEEATDLTGIQTLGFRGEALAAIAQVSRLRLTSRPPGAPAASGIAVEGGQASGTFVAARAVGTSVEVRDLFFNTPARRKFLRTPAAEQLAILTAVERLYLAVSDLGLAVIAEDHELGRYPPSARLEDAAGRVFGVEFVGQTYRIDHREADGLRIEGVLGRPTISRGTGAGLVVAVNGRAVADRSLAQATRLAYQDFLPRTRFPVGVVRLAIEPGRIDVNVHPTKREIRIVREREIAEVLRRTIRATLIAGSQVAEVPETRSAPGELAISWESQRVSPDAPGSGALSHAEGSSTRQQRLEVASLPPRLRETARHPPLELLGCLARLYWIAESDGDLVLLDQHAASERVLYELFLAEGRLARQELVEPFRLRLTPRQRAAAGSHSELLLRSGFTLEPFGGDQFRISSVPVFHGRPAAAEELPRLLDELADGGRPTIPEGSQQRTAASLACHAAIRAGDVVSAEAFRGVLDALYRLPLAAYACPHGRPVLVRFPRSRLDRWFLRSGA